MLQYLVCDCEDATAAAVCLPGGTARLDGSASRLGPRRRLAVELERGSCRQKACTKIRFREASVTGSEARAVSSGAEPGPGLAIVVSRAMLFLFTLAGVNFLVVFLVHSTTV